MALVSPIPVDPEDNPISLAYNSIWNLVLASKMVNRLVRPGNMIQYNQLSQTSPRKDEIGEGDLPEIILVGTGSKGGIRITSNGSEITQTLQWIISTGDSSINRTLLPVMFAIYAAMTPWPDLVLASSGKGIKWRSSYPIKTVNLLEANLGLTNPDQNRGIDGWSAIWSAEILMQFKTQDVLDFNNNIPYSGT